MALNYMVKKWKFNAYFPHIHTLNQTNNHPHSYHGNHQQLQSLLACHLSLHTAPYTEANSLPVGLQLEPLEASVIFRCLQRLSLSLSLSLYSPCPRFDNPYTKCEMKGCRLAVTQETFIPHNPLILDKWLGAWSRRTGKRFLIATRL
jgi:hypothetical protein